MMYHSRPDVFCRSSWSPAGTWFSPESCDQTWCHKVIQEKLSGINVNVKCSQNQSAVHDVVTALNSEDVVVSYSFLGESISFKEWS